MADLCIALCWVSAHCLDTRSHGTGTDKYKISANWHACSLIVQGFGRRSGMGGKTHCLAQGCCGRLCSLRFIPTVGRRTPTVQGIPNALMVLPHGLEMAYHSRDNFQLFWDLLNHHFYIIMSLWEIQAPETECEGKVKMSPPKRRVISIYLKSCKTWKKRWTEKKNGSDTRPFNLDKILNIKKEKT